MVTYISRCVTLFCLAALLGACSADEPTITSYKESWRLLASARNETFSISMPNGETASQTVWADKTGTDYGLTSITAFRDKLYLLHSVQPWIIVLDAFTMASLDTMNLGANGTVADIAFANATTAYVTLPAAGAIGVIDLTTGTLARIIDVGGSPQGIAATGNQIIATLPLLNQAVIVDSRTNVVEARIETSIAPWYAEADDLNNVFCIVALGSGKSSGSTEPPSAPMIDFILATTRQRVKTLEVSGRATNAAAQLPTGLVVTRNEFAFIPVQNGLVRVNTRTRNRTNVVQFEEFSGIAYNPSRAEILCRKASGATTVCQVFDEFGEELRATVTIADSISAHNAVGP